MICGMEEEHCVCRCHFHHCVRWRPDVLCGNAIKEYEALAGAKVNQDKLFGLQLGTWKKLMSSNNVVGRST